ncbi:dipeptide ABC transporter ATP-binding protein [Kineococcus sp. R8]|uniref:dipeptide ABC transporter ATP-binding protein n=1 Tax=Kineococcus siccus TaxID=2696567 RepID=UPI0014135193|nr:ABC transporter ATP-binding protein [Kineococcus siccus]NAZ82041.1 dipeptide ABC transporter ATP-binding protein [Kineococcus siccus]
MVTDPTSSRPAVLHVRGLSVRFPGPTGPVLAASGVDLDVRPGELHALLGESGSGKTVTARAVMGVVDPAATVQARELLLAGEDVLAMTPARRRAVRGERMSMVLQDALSSLNPVLSIGDQLGEVLRVHRGWSRARAAGRAAELLDLVGIANPAHRLKDYPHQFSGGMRQRILIAMAVSLEPQLLIADEPTTALDVTVQAQILRLLHDLRRELDMGVLLITHDIGVVTEVADRVTVMRHGVVVESGDADQVLTSPQAPYSRELLGSVPVPQPARVLGTGAARPGVVLEATGMTRTFSGGPRWNRRSVRAVDDVSVTLHHGETLGVVGESGSGKSTLARMIVGLESADAGRVVYGGADVTRRRGHRPGAQRGVQMVFQDPYSSLDPRMRVRDVVAEPLVTARWGDAARRRDRVAELLDLVGMAPEVVDRFPHQFSGGQRQRIGIARALALDPQVLVCDEPVSALDVTIQAQVTDLLVGLQDRLGVAILFISHDLSVVRNLAHRVLVMHRGRAVETGTTQQIFEAPREDYTRRLLASIPPVTRADRGRLVALAG